MKIPWRTISKRSQEVRGLLDLLYCEAAKLRRRPLFFFSAASSALIPLGCALFLPDFQGFNKRSPGCGRDDVHPFSNERVPDPDAGPGCFGLPSAFCGTGLRCLKKPGGRTGKLSKPWRWPKWSCCCSLPSLSWLQADWSIWAYCCPDGSLLDSGGCSSLAWVRAS